VNTADVTIEGEVERVTYENADTGFRVLKVSVAGRKDALTVVGRLPPLPPGSRVRARGTMIVDSRHGEQLKAEHATELAPNTLIGLEKYLGSGQVPGIGQTYAARIVGTFGMDTLKVLDESPERLSEVGGLGKKRVETIARAWREQRGLREVLVFLQGHGVPPGLAAKIFKRYGAGTVERVSRAPYLLALDVWGVGFRTADRLARELGVGLDSPERLEAALFQAVHDVTEAGHVWAGEEELCSRAAVLLELAGQDEPLEVARAHKEELARALGSLAATGLVVLETLEEEGGTRIAFSAEMHAAEVRLAKRLHHLVTFPVPALEGVDAAMSAFEQRAKVQLAPEQRAAIAAAAETNLLVVTGGPGVGKTTIVRAMLATFARARLAVKLAAPTGRAAKRLAEATGHEASTLHRLLEFDPKGRAFKRNADSPLEAGAIIVDEASMIDLPLADSLLQAVARGTRLVLVGDVDQLPSVGPGAVLRDVIDSGVVRTVRLSRIFRQAQAHQSLIVENAHRIRAGEAPLSASVDTPGTDFFTVERRDPEQALRTILQLVTERIPRRFGLDPRRDVQVLTPMHRGAVGSITLNAALQAALNPTGPSLTRGARTLRQGDKVMQLKNDYDRNVWNGDVGFIARIDEAEEALAVRFEDGREVEYDRAATDQLSLAYATTIHKSQGGEYPAVVVTLMTGHFLMLSRNLFYTAVTRGKRLVVLVADPRAVSLALAEARKHERRTRLSARVAQFPMTLNAPSGILR
jgi:exodeoxyribonuclease V alpha subunit